jgi:hypothetical protein
VRDERESPYWIVNLLAGGGMVLCLIAFASSFKGGRGPSAAAEDAHPEVATCVEQIQFFSCAVLGDLEERTGRCVGGLEILGQVQRLEVFTEEHLNALPLRSRRFAVARLGSRLMAERFARVISGLGSHADAAAPSERRPLEAALQILRRVSRRFDAGEPTVAAAPEGAEPALLCRQAR